MFIKENLGILNKYYVSLAKGNKTEDQQYLIKMEMKYLPLLGEGDGDDIDAGQNDEKEEHQLIRVNMCEELSNFFKSIAEHRSPLYLH